MRTERMLALLLSSILLCSLISQLAIAYTWGRSTVKSDEGDTSYVPGKLSTVKGTFDLSSANRGEKPSPTRSSRQLSYYFHPRTAYRQGKTDYPTLSKQAREQSRPETPPNPQTIQGKTTEVFKKNHPSIYPYVTGSQLRPGSAAQPGGVSPKKKHQAPLPGGEEQQ